jgi:hypothetical protein
MKKIILTVVYSTFLSVLVFGQTQLNKPDSSSYSQDLKIRSSSYKSAKSYILPLALTSYGLIALENDGLKSLNISIKDKIVENHPGFKTSIDNYLQFSPAVATFALKLSGVQGEHNTWQSARLYLTSTILMAGSVYLLKNATQVVRPDGTSHSSFPSGHTATAFAGAEFMHQEFKYSNPILSYTGYLAASATGVLRMYNNRHYLSDVVTGAGIGILTTKLAYWLDSKLFKPYKSKLNVRQN